MDAFTHEVHAFSSTLGLCMCLSAASAPGAEVVKKGKAGRKGKGPGPGVARLRIPAAQAQSELGCAAANLCCALYANGKVTVTGAKTPDDLGRVMHWLRSTLVPAPGRPAAAAPFIRVNSLKTGGALSAEPVDLQRLRSRVGGKTAARKDGSAYRLGTIRVAAFPGLTATAWETGRYRVQGKACEAQQRALAEHLCALVTGGASCRPAPKKAAARTAAAPKPKAPKTPKTPAPKRRAAVEADTYVERDAPAAPRKRARRAAPVAAAGVPPAPAPAPLDLAPAFLPLDDPIWAACGLGLCQLSDGPEDSSIMRQSFAALRADGDDDDGDELCSPPRPPAPSAAPQGAATLDVDFDLFDFGEEEAVRWLQADE